MRIERPDDYESGALKALMEPDRKAGELKTHVENLLRMIHHSLEPFCRAPAKTADEELLSRVRSYLNLALLDTQKPDRHGKRWLVLVDDTSSEASEDALLLPSVLANSADDACVAAEHRYHITNRMPGARILTAWDAEWMVGLAATMLAESPTFAAVVGPNATVTSRDLLPEGGGDDA